MTDDDDLLLLPYRGVNAMEFGMAEAQIAALAGPPESTSTNILKQRVEDRGFCNIAYSAGADARVVHFGFGRQMKGVHLGDIHVFAGKPKAVLQQVCALDPEPRLHRGILIFYELGLTLSGFHDGAVEQRGVTLFAKGTHDNRRATAPVFRM